MSCVLEGIGCAKCDVSHICSHVKADKDFSQKENKKIVQCGCGGIDIQCPACHGSGRVTNADSDQLL